MILPTQTFAGPVSNLYKPAYAERAPGYPYFNIMFKLFFQYKKGEKGQCPKFSSHFHSPLISPISSPLLFSSSNHFFSSLFSSSLHQIIIVTRHRFALLCSCSSSSSSASVWSPFVHRDLGFGCRFSAFCESHSPLWRVHHHHIINSRCSLLHQTSIVEVCELNSWIEILNCRHGFIFCECYVMDLYL